MALLAVEELRVAFPTRDGLVLGADGVSFSVEPGEVLGVVGESGSGKSVTALSVIGLVPEPGRVTGGRIVFEGEDLVRASEARLRAVRGDRIAMIFQDPLSALNPYLTVGDQLAEVLEVHRGTTRKEAWRRAAEMLERVGIPKPGERVRAYPHQLSGGMRQRVLIGMALLCDPALILADEPTSALDVTVQAQILELFRERREQAGTSFVLVTHDLGVLAGLADRAVVMYAGRVVEEGPVGSLFAAPRHPYTLGLARATPTLDGAPLVAIPGAPPSPGRVPPGCAFHPRCAFAVDVCREQAPLRREVGPGHAVRCHVEDVRR
jgi:peptide/nickel transport system ATP-binding protein/oligopeptide transport system ATP-binding protein